VYNPSYQPSFGQQQGFSQQQSFGQPQGFGQQVQSQYRGLQKTFQPTGNVQSFYQPQQTSSFGMNANSQQYHTSSYNGNQPSHDSYLREDSLSPTGMSANAANYHTSSYIGSQPNHDSYREDSTSPSSYASNRGPSSFGGAVSNAQMGSFQNTNRYHTQNYVGNRQDHDAYLREDSLRGSTYSTGRAQGMNTLNNVQGTYNVNTPTSQFTQQQGGFGAFRNF